MCDICDKDEMVGVAAVPGVPVSLAWCSECLSRHCQPLFCVDYAAVPDEDDPNFTPNPDFKPGEDLADWFLNSQTFVSKAAIEEGLWPWERYGWPKPEPGYCVIRSLFPGWTDEQQAEWERDNAKFLEGFAVWKAEREENQSGSS